MKEAPKRDLFAFEGIDEFREEYRKATEAKEEQFVFHGQDVLTKYAKHVLEFIDTKREEYKK